MSKRKQEGIFTAAKAAELDAIEAQLESDHRYCMHGILKYQRCEACERIPVPGAAPSSPGDKQERSLVERLRAAGYDERLSTGALYLEAADALSATQRTGDRRIGLETRRVMPDRRVAASKEGDQMRRAWNRRGVRLWGNKGRRATDAHSR